MNDEYIYCNKCGTRNFSDDKICGVCKEELFPKLKNEKDQKNNSVAPKKTNYFGITLIVIGIITVLYIFLHNDKSNNVTNTNPDQLSSQNTQPTYSILKTDLNNKRGFNVSIKISEKLSENDLETLARQIKTDINAKSEIGILFFYLTDMVVDNGAWATADFKPELKISILGQTKTDENKITENVNNIKDCVGLWTDDTEPGDILIRIRIDKSSGYVFEYVSATDPKPSELPIPLKKTFINGKTVFKDQDRIDQYFILENNGDLSAYDKDGYIVTYKKVK